MRPRAEGVLEYVLIIGVVSLSLSAMNVYLKRGVQARLRDITRSAISGTQFDAQFVTDRNTSNSTITQDSNTTLGTQGRTTTIASTENIHQTSNEAFDNPRNYRSSRQGNPVDVRRGQAPPPGGGSPPDRPVAGPIN